MAMEATGKIRCGYPARNAGWDIGKGERAGEGEESVADYFPGIWGGIIGVLKLILNLL